MTDLRRATGSDLTGVIDLTHFSRASPPAGALTQRESASSRPYQSPGARPATKRADIGPHTLAVARDGPQARLAEAMRQITDSGKV